MYRAKDAGRDQIQLFEDGLRADSVGRFRSEAMLRHALDHDGLRLHYQPLVDLRTGALAGAEALVRLDDPDGGSYPRPSSSRSPRRPASSSRSAPGWWPKRRRRPQSGESSSRSTFRRSPSPSTSSGRQLKTPGFAFEVGKAIARSGADPSYLCFEVTENTLLDAGGENLATLQGLKDLGIRLAIDDFGTGHSSLTWLRSLPADFLKIDRTFVAGVGSHPGDTAIVRAVLDLGRALGLTTVAEGVETPDQLDALRTMGCDWAQGYHLGRPGPAETVTRLIKDDTRW